MDFTKFLVMSNPAWAGSGTSPLDPDDWSIDLNGTNEVLSDTTDKVMNFADEFSIGFWIKPFSSGIAAYDRLLHIKNGGASNAIEVRFLTGGGIDVKVHMNGGGTIKHYTYNNTWANNTWLHVVFTFDGSAGGDPLVLYKDGSLKVEDTRNVDSTGTRLDTTRSVAFGSAVTGSQPSSMYAHSLAIWSNVLSAAEVTSIYNGGNGAGAEIGDDFGNYVSSATLQHWWRIGYDPDDMGADYGVATPQFDLMANAVNITAEDDRVEEAPN
jgi:hypothetical protein